MGVYRCRFWSAKGRSPATGLRVRFVEVQSGCDVYWRVFLLSLLSMLMVVVMRVIPDVTGHSSGIIIFPLSTIITSNIIIAVIIIVLLLFFFSLLSLPLSRFFNFHYQYYFLFVMIITVCNWNHYHCFVVRHSMVITIALSKIPFNATAFFAWYIFLFPIYLPKIPYLTSIGLLPKPRSDSI